MNLMRGAEVRDEIMDVEAELEAELVGKSNFVDVEKRAGSI